MVKIHFIGTCSGTEPMKDRHHSATVIEVNDSLYWFDAGEGCSHTAHTKGLDVLAIKGIFISHPHIDHIGGLPNLLWTVTKMCWRRKKDVGSMKIDLYISDLEMYDHIKALMTPYSIPTPDRYVSLHAACDGLLFENGDVKITAFHNNHIGQTEDGVWRSFSFRIDIGDKRIVHSGDIKNYSELDEAIGEHCDCLIAETGHHNPADVLAYAREKDIKRLYFTHHGRVVLEKRAEIDKLVDAYPYTAKICDDGDIVEI